MSSWVRWDDKKDIWLLFVNSKQHGLFPVMIDAEDVERVEQHQWSVQMNKSRTRFHFLTKVREESTGSRKSVLLHRFVLNAPADRRVHVDHIISRHLFDCRKSNLRLATPRQNTANTRSHIGSSSPHKGVTWHKGNKRWQANCAGKYLGGFKSELAAARAYDHAALEAFGEFAAPNYTKEEWEEYDRSGQLTRRQAARRLKTVSSVATDVMNHETVSAQAAANPSPALDENH